MLHPRAKTMLTFGVPALVIGSASSIILVAVMRFANALQTLLWLKIPDVLHINTQSSGWVLFMLTLTGVAVGALIRYMPGHAGPDPATDSLIGMPVTLNAIPGLLLALVIGLAGGVSLGPENPIIAINIAVAVFAGSQLFPRVPGTDWIILAAAGTLGALFGTPVAAALIFSQTLHGGKDVPLWDRLFPPLLAAGAGAFTGNLFFEPDFTLSVAPYVDTHWVDVISGSIVTLTAIALGMLAVWCFPHVHRLFHAIPNPMIMLGIGGFVLGLLALIGGQITLFRGYDEMKLLAVSSNSLSLGQLLAITLSKLAALVIAAACGFRGGRIFPAVFVGVSLGIMLHNHVDSVPAAITVSCAVMGLVLVVTRDGWLSLFLALAVVPDVKLLPILCIVMLPAWVLLSGKPMMLVNRRDKGLEKEPD